MPGCLNQVATKYPEDTNLPKLPSTILKGDPIPLRSVSIALFKAPSPVFSLTHYVFKIKFLTLVGLEYP
jgi:hypothetical protein